MAPKISDWRMQVQARLGERAVFWCSLNLTVMEEGMLLLLFFYVVWIE